MDCLLNNQAAGPESEFVMPLSQQQVPLHKNFNLPQLQGLHILERTQQTIQIYLSYFTHQCFKIVPSASCQSDMLIIIMIIRTFRKGFTLTIRSLIFYSSAKLSSYAPPSSQCQAFSELLQKVTDSTSRDKAASMMGQLEADEQLYKETLLQLDKDFELKAQQDPLAVKILHKTLLLEQEIEGQLASNREVEGRHYKAVEHNKTYGIARIAKEVIDTADHLHQAIAILQNADSYSKSEQIAELTRIQAELGKVFGKYEISEIRPLGEPFNPNEHESIGFTETEDQTLKNKIAQVKRTGFKLKEQLLRPASVVIYK